MQVLRYKVGKLREIIIGTESSELIQTQTMCIIIYDNLILDLLSDFFVRWETMSVESGKSVSVPRTKV